MTYTPSMLTSHIPPVDSGAYPVRMGNHVRPLIGGEVAFRRICEAVEGARHSAWITVAFVSPDFEFPDGRGHLIDVLNRAAARGLDVRALFWSSPEAASYGVTDVFHGTAEDHALLREREASFMARWDRLDKTYCHHQKSWVIDAGTESEIAFVGGINLGNESVTAHPFPARKIGHTQDIYCELRGPVATDVHHNFVQRWNGASERGAELGAWPSAAGVEDLEFPHKLSPEAGSVPVQLSRTVRRGFYADDTPTPGGARFELITGEYSISAQYIAAIDAAREGIYLENQIFSSPEVVDAIERAVQRGIEVAVLMPGEPSELMKQGLAAPGLAPTVAKIIELDRNERFSVLGLAANRDGGPAEVVYVHTKAAIIDDVWATIGSTNIANRSFYGDTELNASFWDAELVRGFRADLLSLHHGDSLAELDLSQALVEFKRRALANRERRARSEPMQGFTYTLDPARYV